MPIDSPCAISENVLIYDEECFFCSNYVRLLNLRETINDITLVNARDKEKVGALNCGHLDLDEGMVFILRGTQYFGQDAIHHLALLSTSSAFFNTINRVIFSHRLVAAILYPILKGGRRLYLFLARKKPIH